MSDRKSYEKISIEDFKADLELSLMGYLANLKMLKVGDLTFPEWYESFGAWLEVGTSMEEVYYHTADVCNNKECKICWK